MKRAGQGSASPSKRGKPCAKDSAATISSGPAADNASERQQRPGVVRFGTIGSNFIVDNFLAAAAGVGAFQLTAVFSRNAERAKEVAVRAQKTLQGVRGADAESQVASGPTIQPFSDLEAMRDSGLIDAVYVASPTALHAAHSIVFLQGGIHVLCEKPMCSNVKEFELMVQAAQKGKASLLEAMRPLFTPNFQVVQRALKQGRAAEPSVSNGDKTPSIGTLKHWVGQFCQLSSRYPSLLRGERPNAFLPELSNGALMDIGVYAVSSAVALFGPPDAVQYTPIMLPTGVDGGGTLVLQYKAYSATPSGEEGETKNPENPGKVAEVAEVAGVAGGSEKGNGGTDMVATMLISKVSHAFSWSEWQGDEATLSVDNLGEYGSVSMRSKGEAQGHVLSVHQSKNNMEYEVRAFIEMIQAGLQEHSLVSWQHSREVMRVLDKARQSAGIQFPADKAKAQL